MAEKTKNELNELDVSVNDTLSNQSPSSHTFREWLDVYDTFGVKRYVMIGAKVLNDWKDETTLSRKEVEEGLNKFSNHVVVGGR